MLKTARPGFLPILLLISDKLSWKKSHLVRSEILGLCFNALTTYHMYSCRNWEKLPQQVQMQLSSKLWTISEFFYCIFEIYIQFYAFWRKRSASEVSDFGSYCLQLLLLHECLIASLSEHPSRVNVLTGPKHCWNLNCSTFYPIFITARQIKLEKISLSQIWNLRTVF